MNLFRRSRRLSEFATAPLLGMVLALILTVLPLAEKVANWVLAGFFAVCATRLILNRPGARLPALPIKLLLFAGGVGGVIFTYGTALGVEPGFSILVVLVSLKLIEANGPRDFHVLALLGFFLALCDLFSSQDLTRWIYVAAILLLLLATLVRFHRGEESPSYLRSAGLAGTLLLQALPIAAAALPLFPARLRRLPVSIQPVADEYRRHVGPPVTRQHLLDGPERPDRLSRGFPEQHHAANLRHVLAGRRAVARGMG